MPNSRHFKDLQSSAVANLEKNGLKVKYLSPLEDFKLVKYLKQQKGFKFHQKTSIFFEEVAQDVIRKIEKKLQKEYLILIDSDEELESYYETDLDDDSPIWLKDITKSSFTEENPESHQFIQNYRLWVTRTRMCLFGPEVRYWILIVGSDDLDILPEYDGEGELIKQDKDKCYDWWENYLLRYFKSSIEDLYEELGIMICSESFAKDMVKESEDKSVFFSRDENLHEMFQSLNLT